jgi:hypothetical protein
VSKVNAALEQAIIDKAMKEPDFLAQLLRDPMGCLKAMALPELQFVRRRKTLGVRGPAVLSKVGKWHLKLPH